MTILVMIKVLLGSDILYTHSLCGSLSSTGCLVDASQSPWT